MFCNKRKRLLFLCIYLIISILFQNIFCFYLLQMNNAYIVHINVKFTEKHRLQLSNLKRFQKFSSYIFCELKSCKNFKRLLYNFQKRKREKIKSSKIALKTKFIFIDTLKSFTCTLKSFVCYMNSKKEVLQCKQEKIWICLELEPRSRRS